MLYFPNPLEIEKFPVRLAVHLKNYQKELDDFLKQHPKPTYDQLIPLFEKLNNDLQLLWSPFSHLHSVQNNDGLRQSYEQCLPLLSEHETWLNQHAALFTAFCSIQEDQKFQQLTAAQQKFINDQVLDFKRSGIHLPAEKKEELANISLKLSNLSNQFAQNLLDATDAWELLLPEDTQRLRGLPENIINLIKQQAQLAGKTGFLLNLQAPCFLGVITYADDRELRKTIYEAWISRASEVGPNAGEFDNTYITYEILYLKQRMSELLGYPNYAAYSLEVKMGNNPKTVSDFLWKLLKLAKPFAEKEIKQLSDFAINLGIDKLEPWDIAYVSEKFQQNQLQLDVESLRPYFPLSKVLAGLFNITHQLFQIKFEINHKLPRWNEDVMAFSVLNKDNETIAYFYLDLYSRAKKRDGAWVSGGQEYWINHPVEAQKPITFLTCNFTPPIQDQPALLSHDEVVTLFHEFGHCLHHALSEVPVLGLAGTEVEWDAVELPSQLLENWCWEESCLTFLTEHYATQESLPKDLKEKLINSKNFLSGLFLVRQLEFALFDLEIHEKFDPNKGADQIQKILNVVRAKVAVTPISAFNRFQNSFSHIFAGGYAAGYYSYLWAEVLSADAFNFFLQEGILNPLAGEHFRKNILAQGGAEPAAILFKKFLGRDPDIQALLRSYGLLC